MLAFRRVLAGCWVLSVLTGLGSTAKGQEVVPGGWVSEVGFQTFSAPNVTGGFGVFSYGNQFFAPILFGGGGVSVGTMPPSFVTSGTGGVANGLIPLTNAVKRHTRKRTIR